MRGLWHGGGMTGLTVIVADATPDRIRTALTLATAQAALGERARVYFHEASVAALALPDSDADRLALAGLPDRAQLIEIARDSGVTLIACQTGLVLAGMTLDALPGFEGGGMVALLATLEDDRLVVV